MSFQGSEKLRVHVSGCIVFWDGGGIYVSIGTRGAPRVFHRLPDGKKPLPTASTMTIYDESKFIDLAYESIPREQELWK